MATRNDIITRIANEVIIISDELIYEEQNIKAYRITHKQVSGINARGRTIRYWVYDEGGPSEEALMSYNDFKDITLGNRYLDYTNALPAEDDTAEERYHSVNIMEFRYENPSIDTKKIGIYNSSTDKLDIYEGTPPETGFPAPSTQYIKFAQGNRENSTPFTPGTNRGNANKVPLFDTLTYEYPSGTNYIDIVNDEIVLPSDEIIARVDINIAISTGDTTNNDGMDLHFQWQVDGSWIGVNPWSTGLVKQESSSFTMPISSYIHDDFDGLEHRFSLWCWATNRQGQTRINNCSCIVEERWISPENLYINPVYQISRIRDPNQI